jgi:hypothetical protein
VSVLKLTRQAPFAPCLRSAHNLEVIQVHGLCVVGTPVGVSHYVREYVRNKCGNTCKDVAKMRVVCANQLIRYQLLNFCMNTCLSFLSCNITPDNMTTCCEDPAHIGPVHVDRQIVNEVLSASTGDSTRHTELPKLNWCKLKVQSPHHEGGYAITPTAALGLAAFYSATSKFVTLRARLPHGDAWVHDGLVIAVHDTWSNSQLQALVKANARLIQEYKCAERHSQDPAPVAPAAAAQAPKANTPPLLIPPLNQLALLDATRAHKEDTENAQDEVEDACGSRIKGKSQLQSCENGPRTRTRMHSAHHITEAESCTRASSRRPFHAYLGR